MATKFPHLVESRTKRPEKFDLALELGCLIDGSSASTVVDMHEVMANKESERKPKLKVGIYPQRTRLQNLVAIRQNFVVIAAENSTFQAHSLMFTL